MEKIQKEEIVKSLKLIKDSINSMWDSMEVKLTDCSNIIYAVKDLETICDIKEDN